MTSTVHLVMAVLYAGTIGLMIGEGLLTAIRMRRMPPEVLQLRLFSFQGPLKGALVAFGAGITMGIVAVLPMILEVSLPDAWYYGTSLTAAGLAWYAILTIGRVYRVPRGRGRTFAEESLP